ncbi:MAG: hypothetical protein MJE77_20795 [Proteobacteria bacterium]|nr:hypothetical protein [Pseudomonadota bacterium]
MQVAYRPASVQDLTGTDGRGKGRRGRQPALPLTHSPGPVNTPGKRTEVEARYGNMPRKRTPVQPKAADANERVQGQDYRGFIEEYKERAEPIRTDDRYKAFREGLKHTLKGLLNNSHIDYDSILLEGAMHRMGSQEKAKALLEMIWHEFYAEESWKDGNFVDKDLIIADRQFVA